jgi:L-ribulose-5-phosphate 3-epimerase UlaE
MKASILNFEIMAVSGFIYCYEHQTKDVKKKLIENIQKVSKTALITSIGIGLDIPDEEIHRNNLVNWIKRNQKFIK